MKRLLPMLLLLAACGEPAPPMTGRGPGPGPSPVTVPPTKAGESARHPGDAPPAPPEEPSTPARGPAKPALVDGNHPPQLDDPEIPADDLVDLADRYYAKQRYEPASRLYVEATRRDQKHAAAHYGLARAKARQRATEGPCEHDAFLSTVLMHLEMAAGADKQFLIDARSDAAFNEARNTVWYRAMNGANLNDAATVQSIVEQTDFHRPKQGAMDPGVMLAFQPGGVMTERTGSQQGANVYRPREGTWKAGQGTLTVTFEDQPPVTYTLERRGDLIQGNATVAWSNIPDECGA